MTLLNILGIKAAARLQLLVTVLILLAGLALAGGSLVSGSLSNMQPLFDNGAKGMLGVLVMVPFMFVGFDVIPQSAEEVDMPFREIGTTLMLSIFMAVAWYIVVIAAVSGGLDLLQRQASTLPTADSAVAVLGGAWAGKLLVIAGIGGILTSWNAFLIGGSRAIYAMAKSGQLPTAFARLHPRFNTPHNAIMLIGVLSVIAPLFGRPAMVWLVDAGGLGIVVAYAFVALSFLVLRFREPELERPYAVRYWRFTGVTALVLSVAIAMLYLPFSPAALVWPYEWAIVAGWAILGIALFAWGKRGRTRS
jgi:amino acid transporter